jgi:hypothetical protein
VFALEDPVVWFLKCFTVSLNNYENKIVRRRLTEVKDGFGWVADIRYSLYVTVTSSSPMCHQKTTPKMSTTTNDFLCKTTSTKTSGKYGCFSMKYFS